MRVFAGCDGGGTRCDVRIVVCDDGGNILKKSQGLAGPANVRSNPKLAQRNIQLATEAAMATADARVDAHAERMVAALAGAGDEQTRRHWQKLLSELLPFPHVDVLPDVEILFASVEPTADNIVATVIGTGSIAWLRRQPGYLRRVSRRPARAFSDERRMGICRGSHGAAG